MLTIDEIKSIGKEKNQTLQWGIVSLCQEEIVNCIAGSEFREQVGVKGDYIQFGECEGKAYGLPELELLLFGIDEEVVIKTVLENDSEEFRFLEIQEETKEEILEGTKIEYRVYAEAAGIRTGIMMNLLVLNIEYENSIYLNATTKKTKDINGLTGKNATEMRRMYVEGIFVEKYKRVIKKGELLNNMKPFADMYFIAKNYCLDARRIKDYLLLENDVNPENIREFQMLGGNINLIKRWKSFSREIKSTDKNLPELIQVCTEVLEPIYTSIERNEPFFGEWMPELARYID